MVRSLNNGRLDLPLKRLLYPNLEKGLGLLFAEAKRTTLDKRFKVLVLVYGDIIIIKYSI